MSILDQDIVERVNEKLLVGIPVTINDKNAIVLDADGDNIKLLGRWINYDYHSLWFNSPSIKEIKTSVITQFQHNGWFLPTIHDWEKMFGKSRVESCTNFAKLFCKGFNRKFSNFTFHSQIQSFNNGDLFHFLTSSETSVKTHVNGHVECHNVPLVYNVSMSNNNIELSCKARMIGDNQAGVKVMLWKKCDEEDNKHIIIV